MAGKATKPSLSEPAGFSALLPEHSQQDAEAMSGEPVVPVGLGDDKGGVNGMGDQVTHRVDVVDGEGGGGDYQLVDEADTNSSGQLVGQPHITYTHLDSGDHMGNSLQQAGYAVTHQVTGAGDDDGGGESLLPVSVERVAEDSNRVGNMEMMHLGSDGSSVQLPTGYVELPPGSVCYQIEGSGALGGASIVVDGKEARVMTPGVEGGFTYHIEGSSGASSIDIVEAVLKQIAAGRGDVTSFEQGEGEVLYATEAEPSCTGADLDGNASNGDHITATTLSDGTIVLSGVDMDGQIGAHGSSDHLEVGEQVHVEVEQDLMAKLDTDGRNEVSAAGSINVSSSLSSSAPSSSQFLLAGAGNGGAPMTVTARLSSVGGMVFETTAAVPVSTSDVSANQGSTGVSSGKSFLNSAAMAIGPVASNSTASLSAGFLPGRMEDQSNCPVVTIESVQDIRDEPSVTQPLRRRPVLNQAPLVPTPAPSSSAGKTASAGTDRSLASTSYEGRRGVKEGLIEGGESRGLQEKLARSLLEKMQPTGAGDMGMLEADEVMDEDMLWMLSDASWEKLKLIMKDKDLMEVDHAINYCFLLHQKDFVPKRGGTKRGRPKGSRNRPSFTPCVSMVSASSIPTQPESLDAEIDSEEEVVVPVKLTSPPSSHKEAENTDMEETGEGPRRSKRRKKNPFRGTDYVPFSKRVLSDEDSGEEEDRIRRMEEDSEDEEYDPVKEELAEAAAAAAAAAADDPDSEKEEDELLDSDEFYESSSMEEEEEDSPSEEDEGVLSEDDYSDGEPAGRRRGRPPKNPYREDDLNPEERESGICGECEVPCGSIEELLRHKVEHYGKYGKPHECGLCEFTSPFKSVIIRHRRGHREKAFKCTVCEFSTNWEKNLLQHHRTIHEGRKPYQCEICQQLIYNHNKIKQHELSHRENILKCDQCALLFEKLTQLETHQLVHQNRKPFGCTFCTYSSAYKSNLSNHVKVRHQKEKRRLPTKKTIRCDVCNRLFKTEDHLLVHMQMHDISLEKDPMKPFHCPLCEFKAAGVNQVIRHKMIHDESKPFKCSMCSYSTRWKKDLSVHELIHSGEKTIHCDKCDYTCYTKQRLKVHMSRHETQKRFACDYCGQTFKTRQILRTHRVYHTGEKVYKCDECDFVTVTEMRLTKHKAKHSKDRNYSCDLCGKRFKQQHHVIQHRDTVHMGKPSYKERRKMAEQQAALAELSELAPGSQVVMNGEDGVTYVADIGHDGSGGVIESNTQYVLVETPAGQQYVSLVVPGTEGSAGNLPAVTSHVVEHHSQGAVVDGGSVMMDAGEGIHTHLTEIEVAQHLQAAGHLLIQGDDASGNMVYYTTATTAEATQQMEAAQVVEDSAGNIIRSQVVGGPLEVAAAGSSTVEEAVEYVTMQQHQ